MSIYESWEDIPAFEYVNSVVYPSKHGDHVAIGVASIPAFCMPGAGNFDEGKAPWLRVDLYLNRDVVSVVMPRESVALLHGQLADWLGMTVTDPETKRARGKR